MCGGAGIRRPLVVSPPTRAAMRAMVCASPPARRTVAARSTRACRVLCAGRRLERARDGRTELGADKPWGAAPSGFAEKPWPHQAASLRNRGRTKRLTASVCGPEEGRGGPLETPTLRQIACSIRCIAAGESRSRRGIADAVPVRRVDKPTKSHAGRGI